LFFEFKVILFRFQANDTEEVGDTWKSWVNKRQLCCCWDN